MNELEVREDGLIVAGKDEDGDDIIVGQVYWNRHGKRLNPSHFGNYTVLPKQRALFMMRQAIAAWNARAGNAVPVGYVAVYPDGTPYTNHLFNDDNDPQLSPSANLSLVPVYTHPAPAIDAGEVERLVDGLIEASTAHGKFPLRPELYTARAALLEYVSKGGK